MLQKRILGSIVVTIEMWAPCLVYAGHEAETMGKGGAHDAESLNRLGALSETYTPTYSLKAAGVNGAAIGPAVSCIDASPGDTVTVEIRGRCWSNGVPHVRGVMDTLRGYNATLDCDSFFNAPESSGNVLPCGFSDPTDPTG